MKKLAKQDRNGVRTPQDVQRRIKNKEIQSNSEEIKQISKIIDGITIDSTLDSTSTNAVQNKVIKLALDVLTSSIPLVDSNIGITDGHIKINDILIQYGTIENGDTEYVFPFPFDTTPFVIIVPISGTTTAQFSITNEKIDITADKLYKFLAIGLEDIKEEEVEE